MDSVMQPLRIERLNLPGKGRHSQFKDAALQGDRAKRFRAGALSLYMGIDEGRTLWCQSAANHVRYS